MSAGDIKAQLDSFLEAHQASLKTQFSDESEISHRIIALDSRLTMPDCPTALAIELTGPKSYGRINAKLSCNSTQPWSIYVPIEIALRQPVVINTEPVRKGERIQASHLQKQLMDIGKIKGHYFSDFEQIIGLEAKRPLKPGQVIHSQLLRQPLLIKRGETVVLSAEAGALSVKTSGIALSDGRLGQQIRIKNKQSKRTVNAQVTGPGTVKTRL